MPGHTPDHLLVRVVDSVQHTFTSCTLRQPEDDLPIVRGAGEKFFLMWMPCDNCHLVLMTLKAVEFFVSFANIENFDLLISTTGQEPVAIDRVPSNLVNGSVMSMLFVDVAATLSWIPNLNIRVLTARQNE